VVEVGVGEEDPRQAVLLADVQGEGDRPRVEEHLPSIRKAGQLCPGTSEPAEPNTLIFKRKDLALLLCARVGGPLELTGYVC